jgi:hypothetical protein
LLARISSRELSEWMAEYQIRDAEQAAYDKRHGKRGQPL